MQGMQMSPITLLIVILALATSAGAAERDYRFDGQVSRAVLDNYLSRAVTFSEFLHGKGNVADNLRFLTNTGAKFVGRAIYRWGGEDKLPGLLETAAPIAQQAHRADPELILQAACFEIVTTAVGHLPVPAWVFREFELPVEQRHFRYEAMLYPNGRRVDQWSKGGSVPDISQIETRMWFLFLAGAYLDIGVEAIHFGQVEIMDERDKDHVHWRDLLRRVRAYAARHARRHFVLCDAHVPGGGIVHEGRLLLDFHSFPLRIVEVPGKPQEGVLRVGHLDTIYGRSAGGLTPSGWSCTHLPYLVELDNYGVSARPGQPGTPYFTWGYDEISWFARQPEPYRNEWLRYAWSWLREHDTNGWLQMPGSRTLHAPANGQWWYWANAWSAATPDGFNQEETIKAIWARDAAEPITVASYYFGNYHPGDRRNSKMKGAAWSEWELVKAAKPRFPGHQQPKVPLWGYLDESDPKVMAQKIAAAADHGIDAFIFDWYYYDDGPFLDRPIDIGFLQATNNHRLKFAFMWANHDWLEIQPYKRGTPQKLLFPGKVTPTTFVRISDHLIKDYFRHPSYWRIDGRPYLSFYELTKLLESFGSVEATRTALDQFRARARAVGLPGLHLNAVVWGQPILPQEKKPVDAARLVRDLGFDSVTSYVWIHHVPLPTQVTDYNVVRNEYFKYWDQAVKLFGVPYYPNVSMGWDSSPRAAQEDEFGDFGYPFTNTIGNNTPENFRTALEKTKERLLARPGGPRILNINCWNEWTEGSYLEPDTVHGFKYLEAIRGVFGVK